MGPRSSTLPGQPRPEQTQKRIRGIQREPGHPPPGSYTGPVRVIRSEAEFDRIRAGDVLVLITTPGWSLLFPSIGALLTDTGGFCPT
jgi:hypothetical protein